MLLPSGLRFPVPLDKGNGGSADEIAACQERNGQLCKILREG